MNWIMNIAMNCHHYDPTPEEILEYRNETDHDKRIELAYRYSIDKSDLFEDDYKEILKDMGLDEEYYRALNEEYSMLDMMNSKADLDDVKFKSISEYGELMTLQDFIDSVKCGAFIDYDGDGELATETQCSNVRISPSMVKNYEFPDWATHVMWYNR